MAEMLDEAAERMRRRRNTQQKPLWETVQAKHCDPDNPDIKIPGNSISKNGFSPIYKGSNKYWRCTYTKRTDKGLMKCKYCISDTHFKRLSPTEIEEIKKHTHIFPITDFYNRAEDETKRKMPFSETIKSLCYFAGKHNISLMAATSDEMMNLLQCAYTEGQRNPKGHINGSELISRNTFKKIFIDYAKNITDAETQYLLQLRYISVIADAGKLGSKNYFIIQYGNPIVSHPPLIENTNPNFAGNQFAYRNALRSSITNLTTQNFIVSGVVCDNLAVQWMAFSSFQKILIEQKTQSFLLFSCSCHNLALAIKDAVEEVPFLSEAFNSICIFSQIFRSKPVCSILFKACPQYCTTRWNVIYDIAYWIVLHFDELFYFLQDPRVYSIKEIRKNIGLVIKTIFVYAPTVIILLHPFKILSKIFESDNSRMCDSFPKMKSALFYGQTICSYSEFF